MQNISLEFHLHTSLKWLKISFKHLLTMYVFSFKGMPFLPLEDFCPVTIYVLLFITLSYYLSICHTDKLPQTQWLKASETYHLTVSISPRSSRLWLDYFAYRLKSRYQQPSQRQSSLFQPRLLAEFTSLCLCDGYSHYHVSCWPQSFS